MGYITVKGLGKKYKRYPNNWARLAEWLTGGRCCTHEERWALRGVSFEVQSGESVGIVGENGAGKSTLLRILTGTTQASEGAVALNGRVAALLELAMGFHPDFTGSENAVLACQMAGLSGEKIRAALPEIATFSELGDCMDQPLRVYSTGMQMRLAFSAATAIRPEILVVDEVLAVGDAYFQHKCMNRIRSFKEQGTTLLFVSHDPGALKTLCDRAMLLDQGVLIRDGTPDSVLSYYNAMIAKKSEDEEIRQVETKFGRMSTRSGSGAARVMDVEMLDEAGLPCRAFLVGDTAKIRCRIKFNAPVENPTVGILIRDRLGNDVFGSNTYHMNASNQSYEAGDSVTVAYTLSLNLGYGNYSLSVAIHLWDTHLQDSFDWWDQCLVFQVIPNSSFQFVGLAALPAQVEIQKE